MKDLEKRYFALFDSVSSKITILNEGGLFGTCSLTLLKLNEVYPSARRISVSWEKQNCLRDPGEEKKNIFYDYFTRQENFNPTELEKFETFNYNQIFFNKIEFEKVNLYIKNYFTPVKLVKTKMDELIKKYSIDFDNTLVIYYRGTDKWTEVPPLDISLFIKEAKKILKKEPMLKVLVQTDDYFAQEECKKEFGKKAIVLDDLPATKEKKAIHLLTTKERGSLNKEFNLTFLAVVLLMSKCKYVINSLGNVSLWTVFFRGNVNNIVQLLPSENTSLSEKKDLYSNGFKEKICVISANLDK